MDSITTDFWEVLLWSFWFFIWIAALMVWFRCLMDLFGDSSLSGWGKAGWAILLVFVPWLGALIYLIARGRSMTQRQQAAAEKMRSDQEQYIKEVAGAGPSPADQISNGKALLDKGAITPTEFEALKAKALA
jgi:Phospholipase_D-nuclease N-terminal